MKGVIGHGMKMLCECDRRQRPFSSFQLMFFAFFLLAAQIIGFNHPVVLHWDGLGRDLGSDPGLCSCATSVLPRRDRSWGDTETGGLQSLPAQVVGLGSPQFAARPHSLLVPALHQVQGSALPR